MLQVEGKLNEIPWKQIKWRNARQGVTVTFSIMLSLKRGCLAASLLGWPGVIMRCHTGSRATEKSKLPKQSPDLLPLDLLPRKRSFLVFVKSFSITEFLSKWGAGLFFKPICWARCFPHSSVNLVSVEKRQISIFSSATATLVSQSQGCTSLPSIQALSSEPSKEREPSATKN